MGPIDAVFLDMILIEYGIELIRSLILRFSEQEKLSLRLIKLIKYSCSLIFMPILRKKEYLLMGVKINLIHISAVKFLLYFGKMFQILTIINVYIGSDVKNIKNAIYKIKIHIQLKQQIGMHKHS